MSSQYSALGMSDVWTPQIFPEFSQWTRLDDTPYAPGRTLHASCMCYLPDAFRKGKSFRPSPRFFRLGPSQPPEFPLEPRQDRWLILHRRRFSPRSEKSRESRIGISRLCKLPWAEIPMAPHRC